MNFLSQYDTQIADLCRRYSVERLFAFGSVLTDLFGRPVDLLENKALRNPRMRKHIDESKQLIYAK